MKRWMWILAAAGLVMVLCGGAFYGGMIFEQYRRSNVQAQFFAERGGLMPGGGQMPGGFGGDGIPGGQPAAGMEVMAARGAFGTIESIDGDTLILTSGDQSTSVLLTGDTTIQVLVSAERGELVPGLSVSVAGEQDVQGQLTAFSIQILPEGTPTRP